jgi:predicted nucleotidyltransferase
MAKKRPTADHPATERWYRGADVPMREIRRFARQVAEQFHPEKIILFGSYAYGQPHEDSDVDILVVMDAPNEFNQAVKIRLAVDARFPMDLLVRTPKTMEWRLREGDWFLREVVAKGKVLYAKTNGRMGAKSRARLHRSKKAQRSRAARS